jgi:hypothetical protein
MARFSVKPGSGARRATATQQHAQRFACSFGRLQSLAHEPGAATRTESGVPAPVELDLCKTGFRGSPCYRNTTTRSTFRVLFWAPPIPCARTASVARMDRRGSAPPLAWFLVVLGSKARHRADPCKTGLTEAARRATRTQQHAQRFACFLGRVQSCGNLSYSYILSIAILLYLHPTIRAPPTALSLFCAI